MAYTLNIAVSLGIGKNGDTLRARLLDFDGTPVTSYISTGFADVGGGNWIWHYDGFPNDFNGGIAFYEIADLTTPLALTTVDSALFTEVMKVLRANVTEVINSTITVGVKQRFNTVIIKTGVK